MTTALTVANHGMFERTPVTYDERQLQLIKDCYARGATDEEFGLFVEIAKHRRLDILKGHMCMVKFHDKKLGRDVFQPVVKIDGYRSLAEGSGRYEGQTPPQWCGKDGVWRDVWIEDLPPAAARVGVYRTGFREPQYAVARFNSYAQRWQDGNLKGQWATMPDVMIAKCAESLALRKTFPDELGGTYTEDEMSHNVVDVTPEARVEQRSASHLKAVAAPVPSLDNQEGLVTPETLAALKDLWSRFGVKQGAVIEPFANYLHRKKYLSDPTQMTQADAQQMLEWLQQKALAANTGATNYERRLDDQSDRLLTDDEGHAEKGTGLDQWRCTRESQSRVTAWEVLSATKRLEDTGVTPDQWREELAKTFPEYEPPISRKSLSADECRAWLTFINQWATKREAK